MRDGPVVVQLPSQLYSGFERGRRGVVISTPFEKIHEIRGCLNVMSLEPVQVASHQTYRTQLMLFTPGCFEKFLSYQLRPSDRVSDRVCEAYVSVDGLT